MGNNLTEDILCTLSYYDIFNYPLLAREVYAFLPTNSITQQTIDKALAEDIQKGTFFEYNGYYGLQSDIQEHVERRIEMEARARKRWKLAKTMTHILKRFPFISSVIVTGTLSKNIHWPGLDIDYFIITSPRRLWIARTLLIAFKKLFLLNRKDLFCLNYFITEESLEISDKNIFTATEIVHAKVLFNKEQFDAFHSANMWTKNFFPNLELGTIPSPEPLKRASFLSGLLTRILSSRMLDSFDEYLMERWKLLWIKRYPDLTEEKRDALYRVRRNESKAHGPDFQTKILAAHAERCRQLGIDPVKYQTRPAYGEHTAIT